MTFRLLQAALVFQLASTSIALGIEEPAPSADMGLCGPLSANFVVTFYRGSSDLVEIVKLCNGSPTTEQISLMDIQSCLRHFGIDSSAVRLPRGQRFLSKTPAVLHTNRNGGHFMVMLPQVTNHGVVVYEPTVGVITTTWEELDQENLDYALVTSDDPAADPVEQLVSQTGGLNWTSLSARNGIGLAIITVVTAFQVSRWSRRYRHWRMP